MNYINFYNKLIKLTTNKTLYKRLDKQDSFNDCLIIFLFHFAFFLKVYKNEKNTKILQEIYDYVFRQFELSIREIGYGDQTINKKMKEYVNLLFSVIDNINNWEIKSIEENKQIFKNYINSTENLEIYVDYFEKYRIFLTKNSFKNLSKDIITF